LDVDGRLRDGEVKLDDGGLAFDGELDIDVLPLLPAARVKAVPDRALGNSASSTVRHFTEPAPPVALRARSWSVMGPVSLTCTVPRCGFLPVASMRTAPSTSVALHCCITRPLISFSGVAAARRACRNPARALVHEKEEDAGLGGRNCIRHTQRRQQDPGEECERAFHACSFRLGIRQFQSLEAFARKPSKPWKAILSPAGASSTDT